MTIKALLNRLLIFSLLWGAASFPCAAQQEPERFKGWESIENPAPEWFRDAKFGIYFHWGVYSVPAFNSEWYSRGMYLPESSSQVHHMNTYGPPEQFGYKDFIPLFKAEHFDPDEWTALFVQAGARFAGPVAEHADGFSMWDSEVNPWNAKDMGPGRDIVGEMEKAVRQAGLKFITTFHHQWQWGWYPTFNSGLDAGNQEYASLYGPLVSHAAWQHEKDAEKPDAAFSEQWLTKVKEVIQQYQPDLLYFDSRLEHIPESYRYEMVTQYLENTKSRNSEGVILYKHGGLPDKAGVKTHEKSRMSQLAEAVWLTEETISTYSWCYTQDMELRPVEDILHGLIDVVSKNGIYMLNISPKADGTIPEEQKAILLGLGDWLKQNGEAIYNTRPWLTYGEGPRKEAADKGKDKKKKFFELSYTAADVRYTCQGNTIYAILLGKPKENTSILLNAFATATNPTLPEKIDITSISLLNGEETLEWEHLPEGISIKTPERISDSMATVIKIETAP